MSRFQSLPVSFYRRPAEEVARDLVGTILVRGDRRARIVETEAYVGEHDLACHASRGRTNRTQIMFGPAGHAYVYFIYGMHWCLNVVCGAADEGGAVLLRAGEPVGEEEVVAGPRVGVDYAGEAAAWPLRFAVRGNPHVSRPRLSTSWPSPPPA